MARKAERAEVANPGRGLLVVVADAILAHLGIPGALTCCAYLAGRWRVHPEPDGVDPEGS
jgi:hypothetical protein